MPTTRNSNKRNNNSFIKNSSGVIKSCNKCDQIINKKDKHLQCFQCKHFFHIECVHVDRIKFAAITKDNDLFICSKQCKKSGVIVSSDDESEENELFNNHSNNSIEYKLDMIIQDNKEIKKNAAKLQKFGETS